MDITRKDVEHIATLSMLNLNEEEIEGYTKDLQNIVSFAEQIQEVNTENVAESAFALDAYNVFRKDEVKESFNRDLLMQNAPSSNGVQYQLPPVIVD
ncbi:MAG: Asp-tRNA(Asn)/Glu-tRNA(Gln) amidotransferase subunit GatC [Clostridia bacterium]|nr:Asp-tRNA(Asn)/Glu-tRNA(Gln) amidotransferase subunit GatC [Clostridia bacterium]